MQEKIQISKQKSNKNIQNNTNLFFPQIISIQQQKQRLKCPNHNQAYSVCISRVCQTAGLMCFDIKCQCRKIHYKCHHILIDRVLQSIQKHQKKLPQKIKQTYQTIFNQINQMIEKLSLLRNKFEKEEQYYGLRQEQLDFMDLIFENKIQKVNGKIISSLQKTFDIQIQHNNMTKEEIVKDFQEKNKNFYKLCKNIQQKYLCSSKKINNSFFLDSKIVDSTQQLCLLGKWVGQQLKSQKTNLKSKLLFRASQHKFSSKKFHQICDGKNNTLTIIKNQYNKVIGGFTEKAWKIQNNSSQFWIKDDNKKSFVFSLNLKEKYKCLNQQKSIFYGTQYGPTFGGVCSDITVRDQCNINTESYGNLGDTYNLIMQNNNFKYARNQQTYTLFTGNKDGNKFKIIQYEVYQITQ